MKKLISIVLAAAMLLSAFSMTAFAKTSDEDKDYSIESCYIDWDGSKVFVEWDKPYSATSYKLTVYRMSQSGEKKLITESSNFGTTRKDITKLVMDKGAGTYHAVVTAKKDASCEAVSEEFEIDENMLNQLYQANSGTYKPELKWSGSGKTWKLKRNGQYVRDAWVQANDGFWYLFDENGYMRTGWVEREGYWYYLEPVGTAKYPMGAMWFNDVTPDGCKVDANGRWVN